jgi:hypothetical protein
MITEFMLEEHYKEFQLGSCQYDTIGALISYAQENKLDPKDFANELDCELEISEPRFEFDSYEECKKPVELLLKIYRDISYDLWSAALEAVTLALDFEIYKAPCSFEEAGITAIYCYMLLHSGAVSDINFFSGFDT